MDHSGLGLAGWGFLTPGDLYTPFAKCLDGRGAECGRGGRKGPGFTGPNFGPRPKGFSSTAVAELQELARLQPTKSLYHFELAIVLCREMGFYVAQEFSLQSFTR